MPTGQTRKVVNVDVYPSIRTQHPGQFVQNSWHIGNVFENLMRNHKIDTRIRQWQMHTIIDMQLDGFMRQAATDGVLHFAIIAACEEHVPDSRTKCALRAVGPQDVSILGKTSSTLYQFGVNANRMCSIGSEQ